MTTINILEEKDNPVFERKEVKGEFSGVGTISKEKVVTELSVKYKVDESHIDLKYVINHRGVNKGEFFALIYNKPIKNKEENDKDKDEEQNQTNA